ncbi:MAG: BrnT family toxin [Planktothrix sp. GU0601_MAG3]|nr:MAG: BrnT family toxin [Planktothrix sp. GU0601_MAG3]
MYSFEYDDNKSRTNQQKHGIDFIDAQQLWQDDDLLEIQATSETESRFLVIGKVKEKHWTAVITYRFKNIRIISVRRSRPNEVIWYESRRI